METLRNENNSQNNSQNNANLKKKLFEDAKNDMQDFGILFEYGQEHPFGENLNKRDKVEESTKNGVGDNQDREKFRKKLLEDAKNDMGPFGIVFDDDQKDEG